MQRYPNMRRSDLSGVMVNGIPWRGPIVTVGAGKQITFTGMVNEKDTTLFLVYPGTYYSETWYINSMRGHIRGMGTTPGSVVFDTGNYGLTVDGQGSMPGASHFNMIVENVTFQGYGRPFVIKNYPHKITFNKCRLTHGNYAFGSPVCCHPTNSQQNGPVVMRNCYLDNGTTNHFADLNLNLVRLEMMQLNASPTYYSCGGSLALADYVTGATAGYGNEYGEFLITGI